MRSLGRGTWFLATLLSLIFCLMPKETRAEITYQRVADSIERAKRFLVRAQRPDGSWQTNSAVDHQVGVSSLALLSLINAGMTPQDAEVKKGLEFLRRQDPGKTYDVSLMIMALAAAKEGRKDAALILKLVKKLEDGQLKNGPSEGTWGYVSERGGLPEGSGDRSNGQYAVLALREAQDAGVPVSPDTWRRARDHWKLSQNNDGGWGYSNHSRDNSTGSMTVAGIASLVITEGMVPSKEKELNADGTPNCCGNFEPDKSVEDGIRWLGQNFAIGHNPRAPNWLLYYLYGLERAGRLSGRRFFGEGLNRHDWYREGAEFLVDRQARLDGSWAGQGGSEADRLIGTSFALLFLSKGLAPVMINKLEYGPLPARNGAGQVWNRHPYDVRNLTHHISGLEKWPKLVTWQVVNIAQAGVADLMQAPVLFFNGDQAPRFSPQEVAVLRDYVAQGGFIFAERTCKSAEFDEGFRELIKQMYPGGEAKLKQLTKEHPVYRSEYPLDASSVELWGVDVGCRTSIIYSPHDYSCLWHKWSPLPPHSRPPQLTLMITKALQVGVNVMAYATGREPPDKLTQGEQLLTEGAQDKIQRGFIEIAKLRHNGGWDSAPLALRNLLLALNKTAGALASTKSRDLPITDVNIFNYPLLYMHGRNSFQLGKLEQDQLRKYLTERRGVLFADACCSSDPFDKSFRQMVQQLFPEHKLKRIPPTHEMFTTAVGHDLKSVKRREFDVNNPDQAISTSVRPGEPFLEGIEFDGRLVLIYSKYDISCALERQSSVACPGYVHEDAVRLATNIVLYALLQ